MSIRVLSRRAVLKLMPFSRWTLDRWEREGKFPKRIYLGNNTVGWLEDDIEKWLKSRPRGLGNNDDEFDADVDDSGHDINQSHHHDGNGEEEEEDDDDDDDDDDGDEDDDFYDEDDFDDEDEENEFVD